MRTDATGLVTITLLSLAIFMMKSDAYLPVSSIPYCFHCAFNGDDMVKEVTVVRESDPTSGAGMVSFLPRGVGFAYLPALAFVLKLSGTFDPAGDTRMYPCISWCRAEQKSVQ